MSQGRSTLDDKKDEPEILVQSSNAGMQKALEIAESAREQVEEHKGFVSQLFLGSFSPENVFPFPAQSAADARIGDEFCASLSKYLKDHLDPDEVDRCREIPAAVMQEFARRGIFAMKVPKEYGGLGFSQYNYNRVMRLLGSYCGSTTVLVSAHQSIGVPEPLKHFGTPEQKKKYMPWFKEGKISAFALTEPGVGSDPANMSTTAELTADGKHYILNGTKLWCTNGPIADILVVMACTKPKIVRGKERKQITAFIVEANSPGIGRPHRCEFLGLSAIHNGILTFKDVKVPAENMIGGEGRGLALALRTLNTGRLTVPAACTGGSQQCLAIARKWASERVQWGKPIGEHEEGSQKLAQIASLTFAQEAVTFLTSAWADKGNVDLRLEAAMAKLFASEAAWTIVDTTLQLRGGRGYEKASSLRARGEEPWPVERMMRDTRINTIIEGTSDIMRLFLAREAMDPHLNRIKDLLSPTAGMGAKFKALFKCAGFYGWWYPTQWLGISRWRGFSELGPLERHFQYVSRNAPVLARKLFHGMARYQQKLENKQMLLGHLIWVGTEMFAMAATCSYATHLYKTTGDENCLELADHFCKSARRRIEGHFKSCSSNDYSSANRIAERVMQGKMRWAEKGIMQMVD